MSVANISAAWMPDGEIYAYTCQNGYIGRYHANGVGTGASVQLKPSSATPKSQRPVNVVVGPPAPGSTVAPCHLFYREPGKNNIWYVIDNGLPDTPSSQPVSSHQLILDSVPVGMMSTFGAACTGEGVILVGATPSAPAASLTIVTIPWAALGQASWMQGAWSGNYSLPLPEGDGAGFDASDCDVACDVIANPATGASVLLIVTKRKDGKGEYLDSWWTPINAGLALPPLSGTARCWTAPSINFPKVQVRPDNVAIAYYIDNKQMAQWYENTAFGLIGDPNNGGATAAWTPGSQDPSTAIVGMMSKGASKSVTYGSNAFQLVFACGAEVTAPSTANPNLSDSSIPLTVGVVYYNGNGKIAESYEASTWGYMARRGLPVVPGSEMLMGIIEGPPPIPNENLNMSSTYDPLVWFGYPGYSSAFFAGTETTQQSVTMNWSAGLLLKASGKIQGKETGWIVNTSVWMSAQVSLAATYKGAYTSTQSTQSVTTVVAGAEIEGGTAGQPFSVQPAGVLVLMECDWTGYSFGFLNADGSTPDQSLSLYATTPTNISITSKPYLINPTPGPTPGVLLDYVLTPDEQAALEAKSIIDLGNGTGYITASWGYNTKVVPTFTTTSSSSWSNGFSIELDALLSVGAKEELLGGTFSMEGEFGVGISLGFQCAWSSGSSQGVQLGSEVWLRGNSQAPDCYTAYSYYIYLLEQSNQWTTDLLADMITPSFPSNTFERQSQQRLHDAINTGSQPWKMCFAVDPDSLFFNQSTGMMFAGSADLSGRYAPLLAAAGISTTQQLDELLAQARKTVVTLPAASDPASATATQAGALLRRLSDAPQDVAALQELVDRVSRQPKRRPAS